MPGSHGNEIDKIPPDFNLLIISFKNTSGSGICSNTCEMIILSNELFEKEFVFLYKNNILFFCYL